MTDFPLGTQGTQAHSQGSSFGGDFDAARGVVPIRRTDLVMSGSSGFPIAPSRTYNNWTVNHSANIDGSTVLGPRWHLNYDMAIQSASGASDIFLRTSSGGQEILYSSGTDVWKGNTENGGPINVVKSASGYTLTQPDPEIVYTFNLNGKLTKIRTKNGHVQTLTRDANGLLTRIDMDHEDPVKDIDSRYVTFHYDTYTTFTGLAPGSYTRLKKVQSSEGPFLLYEYDANGMLLETKDDRSQRIEAYWNNTSNTPTGNQVPLIVALYAGDGKGGSIEKRNYGYWNGNTMSWMASTPWNNRVYELAGTAYENMVYKSTATDLLHGTKTVYSVNLSRDPVKIQVLRSSDFTTLQKTEQVYVPGTLANFNVPGQMRDSVFPRHLMNAAGTTTFEYLGDNNPSASEYDKVHVSAEVAPDGSRTEYEYDSAYRVTAIKKSNRTTRMAYDARGNTIWEQDPTGNEWVYTYDDLGRVTAIENPTSATTYFAYNARGQVTITTDTIGRVSTIEYDSSGRPTTNTLLGAQMVFGYDSLDRIVGETVYPGGIKTARQYDALNRLTTTTDELGRHTVYEYSPTAGTLTSVTNPNGEKIAFEYDAFGRVSKLTDERGKSYTYIYDLLGRLVSETNPLGRTTSVTYYDGEVCGSCGGGSGSGKVASSTSFAGHQRTFTYDLAGRLVGIEWTGTTDRVELAYDSLGRVTTATDTRLPLADLGGQSFVYGYGSDDRLTTITYPDGEMISYEYDQHGRRTKMTDPDGNVTSYDYDTYGGGVLLTNVSHTLLSGIVYNFTSDKILGSISYGANLVENGYIYDSLKRLSGIEVFNPDTQDVLHREIYTYNDASLRTRINVSATGQNSYELHYGYDSLMRLTDEYKFTGASQNWGRKYGFDSAGNRTSISRHDGATTQTYSADYNDWNQLNIASASDGLAYYGYDLDGNQNVLGHDNPAHERTWHHDREGRLTSATLVASGKVVRYAYDASGRLLLRVAPDGSKEKYYYEGLSRVLVKELPSGGSSWRTKRVYAVSPGSKGQVYGERENTAWSGTTPTAWNDRWLHYDMLGNVVFRTDSSGQVVDRYDMDSYGNVLSGSADGLHLTTKDRDPDTGLYWFGARWYDPVTGRWMEKEPTGADGPNLYWFARNRPSAGADPDGLVFGPAPGSPWPPYAWKNPEWPPFDYGWYPKPGEPGIPKDFDPDIKPEPKPRVPPPIWWKRPVPGGKIGGGAATVAAGVGIGLAVKANIDAQTAQTNSRSDEMDAETANGDWANCFARCKTCPSGGTFKTCMDNCMKAAGWP